MNHTIITAEDKSENGLQTHQIEEVPGKTGNPLHIQITGHDSGLQHGLEADGEREGQFHCTTSQRVTHSCREDIPHTDHESREEGVDPAHDQGLRDHHHHVSLQHTHHSLHACRVSHRVRGRLTTVVGVLQKCAVPEARNHVVLAGLEGLAVEHGACIVAEVHAAEKSKALARFGKCGWRLRGRVHQNRRIVAKDSGQDLRELISSLILKKNVRFIFKCQRTITIEIGKRIQ